MTASEEEKRGETSAELVKELSRDISTLVRQEVELAKAEMTEKSRKAGAGAEMLGGATVLGLAVVGGSMATIILILGNWMPDWLAALDDNPLVCGSRRCVGDTRAGRDQGDGRAGAGAREAVG